MRRIKTGLRNPIERAGDRLGAGGILGQFLRYAALTSFNIDAVPPGSYYALMEALGPGGSGVNGSGLRGGGGAGSDAIIAVVPGEVLSVAMGGNNAQPTATTISRAGVTLLSANAGQSPPQQGAGAGGAGKYPGATGTSAPALGGGRLAGKSVGLSQPVPGQSSNSGTGFGVGGVCLTFFASYEEALAFAKAIYGGTWAP